MIGESRLLWTCGPWADSTTHETSELFPAGSFQAHSLPAATRHNERPRFHLGLFVSGYRKGVANPFTNRGEL